MLSYLIPSSYPYIDTSFADKGGYIACGKEDEGNWQVLHKGNVEAGVPVELNVGAGEKGKCGFMEAALFGDSEEQAVCQTEDGKKDNK